MVKQKPSAPVKRRNPLHDAPLLRKGGVHDKSNKARRQQDKAALRKEWCSPCVCLLKTLFLVRNLLCPGGQIG